MSISDLTTKTEFVERVVARHDFADPCEWANAIWAAGELSDDVLDGFFGGVSREQAAADRELFEKCTAQMRLAV